jgi:hypothetical protein
MKINIIITTFNRSEMLNDLLTDIEKSKADHEISLSVYDDCSDKENTRMNIVNLSFHQTPYSYYRAAFNHGKKKYWQLINKAFSDVQPADYYIMLPDDFRLADNFFDRAIKAWNEIKYYDKICLNLDIDRLGRECWTNFKAQDCGAYYRSQWVDMAFICKAQFFKEVGIFEVGNRWEKDPTLGSGVGSSISRILHNKSLGMYHLKEQITFHGTHESKMNPN